MPLDDGERGVRVQRGEATDGKRRPLHEGHREREVGRRKHSPARRGYARGVEDGAVPAGDRDHEGGSRLEGPAEVAGDGSGGAGVEGYVDVPAWLLAEVYVPSDLKIALALGEGGDRLPELASPNMPILIIPPATPWSAFLFV